MQAFIERLLNEYVNVKNETFANNSFGVFVRNEIPKIIYETGLVNKENFLITGSVGQGNWAMIPWICIFNRSITTSATKGVYIVYLLSKDGNTLYLTFNQGCTDLKNKYGKKEAILAYRDIGNDPRLFKDKLITLVILLMPVFMVRKLFEVRWRSKA